MRRTTIFLDEAIDHELHILSEDDHRPVSHLVREALTLYVNGRKLGRKKLGFVALGRSGRSDTAEKHEALLARELGGQQGRRR